MATTPRFGFVMLEGAGQNNAHVIFNDTISGLELGYAGMIPVEDRNLTAPPVGPAEGDVYLVAASATGDWSGQDGDIARYDGSAWVFTSPVIGMTALIKDEDIVLVYRAAGWRQLAWN